MFLFNTDQALKHQIRSEEKNETTIIIIIVTHSKQEVEINCKKFSAKQINAIVVLRTQRTELIRCSRRRDYTRWPEIQ